MLNPLKRDCRLTLRYFPYFLVSQFRHASKMSHVWVSQEWIASLGLPQLVRVFEEQLVDGRLLNVLTRKDLDKYLSVHKKFHQLSIAFGIELLRMLEFDKEVKCHSYNLDITVLSRAYVCA